MERMPAGSNDGSDLFIWKFRPLRDTNECLLVSEKRQNWEPQMAAFCHENGERSGLQRKGLEQLQNKRQDGDTVRSEGAQSNFSQSWPCSS